MSYLIHQYQLLFGNKALLLTPAVLPRFIFYIYDDGLREHKKKYSKERSDLMLESLYLVTQ